MSQFISEFKVRYICLQTSVLCTVPSYLGLKKWFREKILSYTMQGGKLPTTFAKHQELFPELLYYQFSLNVTIFRGTHYNSRLSPLWIDQGRPLTEKKSLFPSPSVISLQCIRGNMLNCIKICDTVNIVIFKCYTKVPPPNDNIFIKYMDC